MTRAGTILLLAALSPAAPLPAPHPNVLFIVVDDLRPDVGCYRHRAVASPHIDRLASEGILLRRACAQFPMCSPSRCSVLSGLRPTRTRFTDNLARKDREAPDAPSLPILFRRKGYTTLSLGKVYHEVEDDPEAWTEPPWEPKGNWAGRKGYRIAYFVEENKETARKNRGNGPPYEAADLPDGEYPDGKIADRAIQDLSRLKEAGKPFFLAVGFSRKPRG